MDEKSQTWKEERRHTDRATFKKRKKEKNTHAQRWSFNIMSGWERSEKNVPVQHVTNRIHRVHSGTSASSAIESRAATQLLQNISCLSHWNRNRSSITCKRHLHVWPLFFPGTLLISGWPSRLYMEFGLNSNWGASSHPFIIHPVIPINQ